MKMHLSADELEEFEGLSDKDLVETIRTALKEFRASRTGEDDLPQATPGTPSKNGKSEATLETPASRSANKSANDAALEKLIPGYGRLDGIGRL